MYFIIIGVVVVVTCVINFLINKIDLIMDKINIKKYKKLKSLQDKKYILMLESFKKKLDINLKSYLLYNPKALEENCRVQILENEIYIIVGKKINEERIKGSIAHELGHVKMHHEENSKYLEQNCLFLVNLFLLTILLYPILNPKTYYIVLLLSFVLNPLYYVVYCYHIKRRNELEADNIAVQLIGEEYLKTLNATAGLHRILPSFMSDHPSLRVRLKNARKTYKNYNASH